MALLGARSITLVRTPSGQYVNGVWTEGTPTTTSIQASVQPIDAIVTQQNPDGHRGAGRIRVFTSTDLIPYSAEQSGDELIVLNSDRYRVVEAWTWYDEFKLAHCEAIAELRDRDVLEVD